MIKRKQGLKRVKMKRTGSLGKKQGLKKKKSLPRNKVTIHKKKKSPLQNLIKKTDDVFSLLIRVMGADKDGYVKCYTCDYKGYYKYGKIQCGHFRSRANLGVRWYIKNCKPQCYHCNAILKGNVEVFEANLIKEYGKQIIKELNQLADSIVRLNIEQIQKIKADANKQLGEIKQLKGII